MNKVELAREKMQLWHRGQTRWDGRPYEVHPEKVVEILRSFGMIDPELLCAAYLHDVLEDTSITFNELDEVFGQTVASLVSELTYPPKCSDESYWNHTKRLSPSAKLIKCADIIANVTDTGYKSRHFLDKRLKALQIIWQPELI